MDTTPQHIIYPACRTYKWERIGPNAQHLKFWHSIASNAKSASKNPRAQIAWRRVIEELHRLADDESIGELTPPAFKAILIAKAKASDWYQTPSGRKGFTSAVEGKPDFKRCSKCTREKPIKEFNAEASAKRKLKYNWGRDGKPTADRRLFIHALCASCRAERTRRPKAAKGEIRGANLRKQMEAIFKLSRNFIVAFENEYDVLDPEWVCVDQRYFFHKVRLDAVRIARDALDKSIGSNEPIPEKWQMLLPVEIRHGLFKRFNDDVLPMWSGKGKQPKCF